MWVSFCLTPLSQWTKWNVGMMSEILRPLNRRGGTRAIPGSAMLSPLALVKEGVMTDHVLTHIVCPFNNLGTDVGEKLATASGPSTLFSRLSGSPGTSPCRHPTGWILCQFPFWKIRRCPFLQAWHRYSGVFVEGSRL